MTNKSFNTYLWIAMLISAVGCDPQKTESVQHNADKALSESVEELSRFADTIVEATVMRKKYVFDESKQEVYTDITLSVSETLKGSPLRERVVRMPGGVYGDDVVFSPHLPQFEEGERYVLFMSDDLKNEVPFLGKKSVQRIVKDVDGIERLVMPHMVPLQLRESEQAEEEHLLDRTRARVEVLDHETTFLSKPSTAKGVNKEKLMTDIRKAVRS